MQVMRWRSSAFVESKHAKQKQISLGQHCCKKKRWNIPGQIVDWDGFTGTLASVKFKVEPGANSDEPSKKLLKKKKVKLEVGAVDHTVCAPTASFGSGLCRNSLWASKTDPSIIAAHQIASSTLESMMLPVSSATHLPTDVPPCTSSSDVINNYQPPTCSFDDSEHATVKEAKSTLSKKRVSVDADSFGPIKTVKRRGISCVVECTCGCGLAGQEGVCTGCQRLGMVREECLAKYRQCSACKVIHTN